MTDGSGDCFHLKKAIREGFGLLILLVTSGVRGSGSSRGGGIRVLTSCGGDCILVSHD